MKSFEFYESHSQSCIDSAMSKLNSSSEFAGQQKLDKINEAQDYLLKAQEGIAELQNGIILLPTNERTASQRRLQLLQNRVKEIEDLISNAKQRQRLLGHSQDLKTNAAADESMRQTINSLSEGTEIGKGILASLSTHREKLVNAHSNLNQMSTSVGSSTTIVNRMESVQRNNKIIMWIVIILLIGAIAFLLYMPFLP